MDTEGARSEGEGGRTARISGFLVELKRRKVFHVAGADLLVGATIAGAANDVLPALGMPPWTVTFVIVLTLLGFPLALVLAWGYDLRPEGAGASTREGRAPAATSDLPQQPIGSVPGDQSIVILPFDDLGSEPDNAFFGDGLTDELITDLSKVRDLRVISRSSARLVKAAGKDVRNVARELGVRYVLEGSVRRDGAALRINAQLIDGHDASHVWADKYTGTLQDVFDLQERLSRRIVEALQVTLTRDEERDLGQTALPDVRAYDVYLRARQELYTFTAAGLDRALELTNEALAIAGPNALLYASLAQIYFHYYDVGIRREARALEQADRWVERALELDPGCAPASVVRGLLAWHRGEMGNAIHALRTAVEQRSDGAAYAWLGYISFQVGRIPEARVAADRAVSLDPLLWVARLARAAVDVMDGDRQGAALRMEGVPRPARAEPVARLWLGIFLVVAGRDDEARRIFTELSRLPAAEAGVIPVLASVLEAATRRDRAAVETLLRDHPELVSAARTDKEMSWWLADAFARTGAVDEAIDWVANAVDLGFVNYPFWSRIDPALAPLRSHSGFEQLMERCKGEWESIGAMP